MHSLQNNDSNRAMMFNKVLCRNLGHLPLNVYAIKCIGNDLNGRLNLHFNSNVQEIPGGNQSIFMVDCKVKKSVLFGSPILEPYSEPGPFHNLRMYVSVFADNLERMEHLINKLDSDQSESTKCSCIGSLFRRNRRSGEKIIKVSDIANMCSIIYVEVKSNMLEEEGNRFGISNLPELVDSFGLGNNVQVFNRDRPLSVVSFASSSNSSTEQAIGF